MKKKRTLKKRIVDNLGTAGLRIVTICGMAVLSVIATEVAEKLSESHLVDSTVVAIATGIASALGSKKA